MTERSDRALLAALLCFTKLLDGYSHAGGGGLFIVEFTHSEIANGLTLLTLYFAATNRIAACFALNGATFFVNAFIGVWNAVPIGLVLALHLLRDRPDPRPIVRSAALGLAAFALLAAPVLLNILANPDFGRPIGYDYREYLRLYWPYHFLFDANRIGGILAFGAVVATAILAFHALGRRARAFQAAVLGYGLVYALGIAAPLLTDRPLVLNLHLLRSGGCLHLLAALGACALAVTWLRGGHAARARIFGPLLVLALCTFKVATLLAPLVLAAGIGAGLWAARGGRAPAWLRAPGPWLRPAALVGCLVFWPYAIGSNAAKAGAMRESVAEWEAVGRWARANTAPEAAFLIPTFDIRLFVTAPERTRDQPGLGSEIFRYAARRQVWVDYKQGAEVMWSPSLYPLWSGRIREVLGLSSLQDKLDYAARHGLAFVVEECRPDAARDPVFAGRRLCVYAS